MLISALCLTGCGGTGTRASSSAKSTAAVSSSEAHGTPYSEPNNEATAEKAYVNGDNVKFRIGPGTDKDVIETLKKGTVVGVIAKDKDAEGWSEIKYNGTRGYISSQFLSSYEPEPDGPSVEDPTKNPSSSAAASSATPSSSARQPSSSSQSGGSTGGGRIVCIDPGHQAKGDSTPEPIGPGASETKARVTGGTSGVATGLPEYKLTLQVSLKLQAELSARGYTVIMTRSSDNVNISNSERAAIANNAGAGAFIRIHANGSTNQSAHGALTMCQTASNPYNGSLHGKSYELSKAVLSGLVSATGCASQGVSLVDNMSGINWAKVPVTIVEMGYMSNPTEDRNMADPSYQSKIVAGIANGIDAYFGR